MDQKLIFSNLSTKIIHLFSYKPDNSSKTFYCTLKSSIFMMYPYHYLKKSKFLKSVSASESKLLKDKRAFKKLLHY